MQEFAPQPKEANFVSTDTENPYSLSQGIKANSGKPLEIKEKKSFYKTTLAKIIAIVFVLITIGIALVGISVGMRTTNWIKFGIIILPGTFYMVSRVFVRSTK